MNIYPLWLTQINNCSSESVGYIANTLTSLFDSLNSESYQQINEELKLIDMKTMNSFHLVAALRVLAPHRNRFSYWADLIQLTNNELQHRGLDNHRILFGLL